MRRRAAALGLAALGLASLALAGCGMGPGAKIGQAVLRGGDIERMVSSHSFVGQTASGAPIEVFYRRDGVVFIRGQGSTGIPFQDYGRWWVQSDRLCTRYQRVRGRKATCEWVTVRARDFRTYEPGGDLSARGELYEGAPVGIDSQPSRPPTKGG